MEERELNIGNWYNYLGRPTRIKNRTELYKAIEDAKNEALTPIPLDEAWLRDFEFEKAQNGWWDKHEIFQIIYEDGIFLAYWHGAILCKLEYVHRLQNLYYELSDEELIRKQK